MTPSSRPARICIVAHQAFGALAGGDRGHAGGVEHQTSLTARWLAARGHRVSMVVWDEGQPDGLSIDGVEVRTVCAREAGVPIARFVHPRWTSLVSALAAADADLYYHNCAEYVTGQVALWCRLHRRRFVYSVASDPECDPALPSLRHRRERVLFRYGLRTADRIIVQTAVQQAMLRRGFGLSSVVLPMPCVGPRDAAYLPPSPPSRHRPRVLWVGRLSAEKRPELLADVAEALPWVTFEVAGSTGSGVAGAIGRLTDLANVTMLGRVARDRMDEIYAGAAALLCTSAYEGFPNTFLEAWSHGVPVVSTVDPDGLIASRGLGRVAGTGATLTAALATLLENPGQWRQASDAARRCFSDVYSADRALPAFESVFLEAVGAGMAEAHG